MEYQPINLSTPQSRDCGTQHTSSLLISSSSSFFSSFKKINKKILIRVRGKITGIWWNTSQSTSPHHKAETMSHNTPPIYFNSSFFLVFCFCCCLFVCLLLFWGGGGDFFYPDHRGKISGMWWNSSQSTSPHRCLTTEQKNFRAPADTHFAGRKFTNNFTEPLIHTGNSQSQLQTVFNLQPQFFFPATMIIPPKKKWRNTPGFSK